jgi:hypothetical protein
MANTFTANYNMVKPEVGAATNQWGGLINSNLDTIDTQIKARETAITNVTTTANAALPKDGSAAMTGMLTLPSNISPTNNFHATTKKYVDDKFMPFAGGAFTGLVTLNAQPTDASADLAISSVKYVKDKVSAAEIAAGAGIPLAGNPTAMTGYLTLNAPPVNNLHAATKQYVDTGDNAATAVANTKLPRDGSQAMTGPLSLAGNPSSDLHAVPRQFLTANYVPIAGNVTMTGPLILSGDPTNPNGAVNRSYLETNYINKSSNINLGVELFLKGNASSALQAVPYQQLTNYVPTAGGVSVGSLTETGNITFTSGTATLSGTSLAISCYSLTATGDVILQSSDYRIKEDIRTIENAVDITKQLRGVSYVRKDTGKLGIGVVAQEVEQVLPQLVATDANGMKSVAYANMVGILIEAVKELSARVEELEAR